MATENRRVVPVSRILSCKADEDDMKNPVCFLLALVMTLVLTTATPDDNGPPVNLTVDLGSTATIRCPVEKNGIPVTRLYIQKFDTDNIEIFINGFDKSKPLDEKVSLEYQNRTKVNREDLSMEMTNVSVSDEGLYKCVVFFSNMEKKMPQTYLKVRANYSVPTIERECSDHKQGADGKICQLKCSSVGGYPEDAVSWSGLNTSLIKAVYNNSSQDHSKTWTINQTIIYTCDHPINVNCTVRREVSPTITICETEPFPVKVIIAIAVVVVFVLLFLLILMVMKYCFQRSANRPERGYADLPLADCHSQLKSV
ncbi:putative selection and upkeep of intraepithelial T-cells protein 1 homolog isoform X2 [Pseudorasbora parva]|uniref:putative selection and upkeep of intraepithelial T-cells protein 1 homolog isoform X2 n=1 Tax=Pseudorasbora parva TaxID=51549 RepID=UPI00351E8FFC